MPMMDCTLLEMPEQVMIHHPMMLRTPTQYAAKRLYFSGATM